MKNGSKVAISVATLLVVGAYMVYHFTEMTSCHSKGGRYMKDMWNIYHCVEIKK